MITGKLGKTANGLISLKEKNNSQGLFDMGISRLYGVGNQPMEDEPFREKMKALWKVSDLPGPVESCLKYFMAHGQIRNIFIFGEDPIGCATEPTFPGYIRNIPFKMVQDYFMTDTAKEADLVLPATFPAETGGSFTNTQRTLLGFEATLPRRVEKNNIEQLSALLGKFGKNGATTPREVFMEYIRLLPDQESNKKLKLRFTANDNSNRTFDYGCDYISKRAEKEFEEQLSINS